METKKFCLTERQMPTQWYNIVADMPNKPLPPLHPATKQPVTKGADERHLRRRTDRPGDVDGAFHRHPRRGAGDLQDMAAFAAGARHGTGKSPRHPGKDLFQERKRIARRIAQAQHRRAAGLLQLQAGHTPPDDRNGRRAVGRGHRLRSQAFPGSTCRFSW